MCYVHIHLPGFYGSFLPRSRGIKGLFPAWSVSYNVLQRICWCWFTNLSWYFSLKCKVKVSESCFYCPYVLWTGCSHNKGLKHFYHFNWERFMATLSFIGYVGCFIWTSVDLLTLFLCWTHSVYVINFISRELTEGRASRQGVHVISYPEADKIQPFPLRSRHEASGTVWRAWLWIGPAGMVIECLRHVRFDIWKSEWLAFVCAPGLALALHVSCRAAWRKGRKRKVYISAQTDEHRLLECIWDGRLWSCWWSPALFQWRRKSSMVSQFALNQSATQMLWCLIWLSLLLIYTKETGVTDCCYDLRNICKIGNFMFLWVGKTETEFRPY